MNIYECNKKFFESFDKIRCKDNLLPIKVTDFYLKKIEEERKILGDKIYGPLYRIGFPTEEKVNIKSNGEVKDFVDDKENILEHSNFIQKYHDRALYLTTTECFGHCQYCFREDLLEEKKKNKKEDKLFKEVLNKINYVDEIILSGGDPMTMSDEKLDNICFNIKEAGIKNIRLHSRSLIYSPHSITDTKIEILKKYSIRFVSHIVHPYEICDVVKEKISKLLENNIRLYNQFPILRNVNDNFLVLKKLLTLLDELYIRNLSMFIPDPITYSACYRMTLKRLFSIMDELNWNTPSWINSTRLVLDTKYGKVRREDLQSYDERSRIAIFRRDGKNVEYPDFLEELDKPGNINVLLWKN